MKKSLCLLLVFLLLVSTGCAQEPKPEVPDVEGWTLEIAETQSAPEGIAYKERVYRDEEGKPYRVCILE